MAKWNGRTELYKMIKEVEQGGNTDASTFRWDKSVGSYSGLAPFMQTMLRNLGVKKLADVDLSTPEEVTTAYIGGASPGSILYDKWLGAMGLEDTQQNLAIWKAKGKGDYGHFGNFHERIGSSGNLVDTPIRGKNMGRHLSEKEILKQFYPAYYQKRYEPSLIERLVGAVGLGNKFEDGTQFK